MAIRLAIHAAPKRRRKAEGSILIPELGGARLRTAVVTVNVAVCGDPALGLTMEGETRQLASAGAPLQLSATCWLKPPIEEMISE